MQIMSIVASIMAILSYYYVTKKDIKGLYGWIFSNSIMLILAIIRFDVGQIILWVAYDILNVYGIYNWRKCDKKAK